VGHGAEFQQVCEEGQLAVDEPGDLLDREDIRRYSAPTSEVSA